MSFISPIPTDANGNPRATGSLQSLGKDDFLRLLVAKMEYQDPLDPQSDEDFIAQLAQFSSLEQMSNMSEALAESNQLGYLQMQSLNNAMSANLIGKEVVASYDGVYFDGDSDPQISFTTEQYAERLELTITDEAGNVIRRIREDEVAPGRYTIEWDGRDDLGNKVSDGFYNVKASAIDANEVSFAPQMRLVGVVDSISYRDGSAYLHVNGSQVSLGDIVTVGEPGSFGG